MGVGGVGVGRHSLRLRDKNSLLPFVRGIGEITFAELILANSPPDCSRSWQAFFSLRSCLICAGGLSAGPLQGPQNIVLQDLSECPVPSCRNAGSVGTLMAACSPRATALTVFHWLQHDLALAVQLVVIDLLS